MWNVLVRTLAKEFIPIFKPPNLFTNYVWTISQSSAKTKKLKSYAPSWCQKLWKHFCWNTNKIDVTASSIIYTSYISRISWSSSIIEGNWACWHLKLLWFFSFNLPYSQFFSPHFTQRVFALLKLQRFLILYWSDKMCCCHGQFLFDDRNFKIFSSVTTSPNGLHHFVLIQQSIWPPWAFLHLIDWNFKNILYRSKWC